MDLVNILMDRHQRVDKIKVSTGTVTGVMNADSDDETDYQTEEFFKEQQEKSVDDYAIEYKKREEELYSEATFTEKEQQDGAMSTIDAAEDLLSSVGRLEIDTLKQDELQAVYKKYNFDKKRPQGLLIDNHREQILNLIHTNQVVIIQGPTGCGKTTQVPQFILDDCRANAKHCRIIVTQPRRIAAISVARRVCDEREWELGGVCGYQVGLERDVGRDTLLAYVTTGVLLQKLIKQKNLHEYTHIIVDEVHERNQDMDFLLLILRKYLNTNSPTTRLILMSATFDTEEFAAYFKNFHHVQMIPAPVIYVGKQGSRYSTQTFYIEQLNFVKPIPTYELEEPKIDAELYQRFVYLIRIFDKLDEICPLTGTKKIGHVLVFLPGIFEIEEADNLLRYHESSSKSDVKWTIIPLHSSITTEEQRKVFLPPPPGTRKIILSTNIAESSITVPDIVFVVDFCLTKIMSMDSATHYQTLKLEWASHINCIQRAGRVGRVGHGRVYRLVSREFYDRLKKNVQPEILRAPLNQLVLAAKLLEFSEPPKAVLALAMNPPDLTHIDTTVLYLKEIGALARIYNGRKSITNGDLTFLGQVMARLPLDVHLSKFILLGHMFSCLEPCIIMGTGCSLNIFRSPFKERLKAYTNRLQWADGSSSDLIAYLNLFQVWQRQRRTRRDAILEQEWCKKNHVSQKTLREWDILVKEVKERLAGMKIRQSTGPGHIVLSQLEIPTVVKVVICGAFYPNYYKRSSDAGQVDEREAVKVLGGRDPFNTVYFTGFDPTQPGPLYVKSIKKLLADVATHMQVSFDNSSKVYIQFTSPNQVESVNVDGQEFVTTMPGKIAKEVYRAVRLRHLKPPNRLSLMNKERAWELAKQQGIEKGVGSSQLPVIASALEEAENNNGILEPSIIPTLDIQYIILYISERIDAGHFWAHNMIEDTTTIKLIFHNLNSIKLEPVQPENIVVGGLYAALYQDDMKFYRCKVLSYSSYGRKQSLLIQVIFIDYGNTAVVGENDLFELPNSEVMSKPGQAIECFMSEIQPSCVLNPRALWVETANQAFDQQTQQKLLYGKIYSVVNGIVHLELHVYEPNVKKEYPFKNSLNAWLIEKGHAQPAEESYLSKENHLKRLQLMENPEKLHAFLREEDKQIPTTQDIEPPSSSFCTSSIALKGPCSPLEMQIYSVVSSGYNKQIRIESDSVNTVILDTDPQDPHERLIVAAHINQNPSGTGLILRHTTVMPNIHGFPMLMSLLFCPVMEPKPLADGSRIGAVLCGLGSHDNTHTSIYPPHDICLGLDTDLTEADINMINELRYWLNMSIRAMESDYQEIPSKVGMGVCQRELKTRLFRLLKTPRKSIEREYVKHSGVWGKTLFDADLLQPGDLGNAMNSEIWPLHWTIKLNRQAENHSAIKQNLNELEEVAKRMRHQNSIICDICQQTFHSAAQVRIHLASKQHNDKMNLLANFSH